MKKAASYDAAFFVEPARFKGSLFAAVSVVTGFAACCRGAECCLHSIQITGLGGCG
jgi:hypothetical protein